MDNIIGSPNTYCWIVIYAMVSAIQHLNNWVQGITVVSRETEDSVCLCKVLGDKQGGDFFKIGITVLGILGVCVPPGFPNPDPIIGVRAGGARGAAAPPKFGQLRFFGQQEKIWAKPVFKDVSMFFIIIIILKR